MLAFSSLSMVTRLERVRGSGREERDAQTGGLLGSNAVVPWSIRVGLEARCKPMQANRNVKHSSYAHACWIDVRLGHIWVWRHTSRKRCFLVLGGSFKEILCFIATYCSSVHSTAILLLVCHLGNAITLAGRLQYPLYFAMSTPHKFGLNKMCALQYGAHVLRSHTMVDAMRYS